MTVKPDRVFFKVAATPSGIASYSGLLFIVPQRESLRMIGGICHSNDNTSTPPTPLQPSSSDTAQISCPMGSQLIHSMHFSD